MKGSRLRLRLTRLLAICVLLVCGLSVSYWTTEYPIVEKSLFITGIALAGFGAAGRAWATSYISGQKMKQLVTSGPYSMCRNPLYFFSLILAVGLGFCTKSFSIPLVIGIGMLILSHLQILREESRLLEQFGDQFSDYLKEVPRLFPSFRHYIEPEEITISPRLLKRGLFGIAFLLILIGVIELLEGLHEAGVLPVWFHIY